MQIRRFRYCIIGGDAGVVDNIYAGREGQSREGALGAGHKGGLYLLGIVCAVGARVFLTRTDDRKDERGR